MNPVPISIIIPTIGIPELFEMLASVATKNPLPDQVIVVVDDRGRSCSPLTGSLGDLEAQIQAHLPMAEVLHNAKEDWQMNNQVQLSGNLKYLYHEGFPSNWNPSLRVTYKPCEPVYLQGHAGFYSNGLHSNYPVFEYYVPKDMMTRFGEKPQLYYGAEFSLQF